MEKLLKEILETILYNYSARIISCIEQWQVEHLGVKYHDTKEESEEIEPVVKLFYGGYSRTQGCPFCGAPEDHLKNKGCYDICLVCGKSTAVFLNWWEELGNLKK